MARAYFKHRRRFCLGLHLFVCLFFLILERDNVKSWNQIREKGTWSAKRTKMNERKCLPINSNASLLYLKNESINRSDYYPVHTEQETLTTLWKYLHFLVLFLAKMKAAMQWLFFFTARALHTWSFPAGRICSSWWLDKMRDFRNVKDNIYLEKTLTEGHPGPSRGGRLGTWMMVFNNFLVVGSHFYSWRMYSIIENYCSSFVGDCVDKKETLVINSDSGFARRKLDTILECAGRKWINSSWKPPMFFLQHVYTNLSFLMWNHIIN